MLPCGEPPTNLLPASRLLRGIAPPLVQRIALYSHDALGLGHLRRNLAIADALAHERERSILLITGAREAAAFRLPPGVDVLALPAFAKGDSDYRPRRLNVSAARLARLRAATIDAALEVFEPHAVVVDKHPLGVHGELQRALQRLDARGARLVLGLRDVLEEPVQARAEWSAIGGDEVVARLYSRVWVYGDPRIYDVVRECGFGVDVAAKVHYTGYVTSPRCSATHDELDVGPHEGGLAVCAVGGGEDGGPLVDAFARARLPDGMQGIVLCGPFLPDEHRERLRRCAGDRLRIIDFTADPGPLFERADRVVSMGGYNTVCELLRRGKKPLIVPRRGRLREQAIRAERLRARGAVDLLAAADATPAAISEWLARPQHLPEVDVDLDGLQRVPRMLEDVLTTDPGRTATAPLRPLPAARPAGGARWSRDVGARG